MYAAVITLPSSFGSWNRGPYIWQTWPQWHIYVSDGGQKNEGVEKNQNADSLGRDFEFCCLCFFPPSPIFSERIRTAARYILETPTRDKSKQKIGFYAHLFSKATEVSKVRLQHFSLGSFLRDVDEMRNLWRESIGADQLKFLSSLICRTFWASEEKQRFSFTCEAVGLGGRAGGGGSHPLLTPKNPDK